MKNIKNIVKDLEDFLHTSVEKTGAKGVVVGLSGGLDSAVVALLAHRVFKDNLHPIMLPTHYSSQSSVDDAMLLCKKFDLVCEKKDISEYLKLYEKQEEQTNRLRVGNFSSRLRMVMLYDLSAKYNSVVLGTSNKSELMLGYGTIYGDMASAINPIANFYKSEVFELAKYLGVPDVIVNKPPSADWYESQSDEADLGFSYSAIDEVLSLMIDEKISSDELVARGFDKSLVGMIEARVAKNSFKREMPKVAQVAGRVSVW